MSSTPHLLPPEMAALYNLMAEGTKEFFSLSVTGVWSSWCSSDGRRLNSGVALIREDRPDLGERPLLHHLLHRVQTQSNHRASFPYQPAQPLDVLLLGAAPNSQQHKRVHWTEQIDKTCTIALNKP